MDLHHSPTKKNLDDALAGEFTSRWRYIYFAVEALVAGASEVVAVSALWLKQNSATPVVASSTRIHSVTQRAACLWARRRIQDRDERQRVS